MLEGIRPRREDFGSGPGGLDDFFGSTDAAARMVTVNHGVHTEPLPVANMTVGEIRARYADRFDIDPRSETRIDGSLVGDDTMVRAGQLLMFVRYAGEKGLHFRRRQCAVY